MIKAGILAGAALCAAIGVIVALDVASAGPPKAPAPKVQTAAIMPQPMPGAFPVSAATIDKWIATSDMTAERGHAWSLWADMNRPSGQIYGGANLPIWETWYGFNDVFPPASKGPVTLALLRQPHTRTLHAFQRPVQFHHNLTGLTTGAASDPSRVVAFNKFAPDEVTFLLTPHPGPGGKPYMYNTLTSLNALNAAWPKGATGQQRGIADFPVKSIETKPVFGLVKATGLTPLPLWQEVNASTRPANPTPTTWTNCVLIDPVGTGPLRPATPAEVAKAQDLKGLSCKTFYYGTMRMFYSFRMNAAEAAAFTAAQNLPAKAGDYAVLMAMHVNTKEIPFWTWQTFYWQPGKDAGFPGSKAGMPPGLPSPWNNYATCANYDQTTTPNGKTMQVCFNPYLETSPSIPVGITSNCMSCHGTARVALAPQDEAYPAAYTAPIPFFTDPKYYNGKTTHTDFSWAVPSAN